MENGKWKCALTFVICHLTISVLVAGCERSTTSEVVLYTSVDEPVARPIVRDFEKQTGIHVILQTDTEATRSVGLAERLRAEKSHPQADVWWSNEPFHSAALAREGALAEYESPAASDVPAQYKDANHRWAGNGLRARVIALHGESKGGDWVKGLSLTDFCEPALKGKIAMASPTAGTTAGHVAALYAIWGDERTNAFFRDLKNNEVKLLGGNGPVAEAVARGTVVMGLTDNDDVVSARDLGKISAGLPDQGDMGTLLIPTTVGLVAGGRHAEAGKRLIDYLLSSGVEKKLIEARFAGWSVRDASAPLGIKVDYARVAEKMPEAIHKAAGILQGRE